MKIKDGYILRSVAGSNVVVPVGKRTLDFNGMITLNDTGAFIWQQLEHETDENRIVAAILESYEVEEPRARSCVQGFVEKLREVGCLEE